MASSHEEDLDWLYGRDRPRAAPEPTRVLPAPAPPVAGSATPGAAGPIAARPAPEPPPLPPGVPGAPGGGGRPGPPGAVPLRPRRRRHPVRTVLGVLVLLVVLALGWLVGVPAYAWSSVHRVDDAPGGSRPADQPGQTFLLVGSDSREGLTKAQRKQLGTGSVAGQRTDTIMLLHVPTSGKPALVSVPRDSYVAVPGHGHDKINAAYAIGGAPLLVRTVEADTGLRIDGYLEVGFGGFVDVVDAVDGVHLCLPRAISDADSHLDLPKGCQTLDGTQALGYVRMRKADPRGDLGRVERQRQVLAAVAGKAASARTVLDPVRYWRLNTATADALTLGQDTSLAQVARLGLAMRTIASGGGLTLTVPISNPDAPTPAGSAVLWDDAKAQAMFGDLARGDTSGLAKYAQ